MNENYDPIKNGLFIFKEWCNNLDNESYIYLNSDKTFGLRESKFSILETIFDIYYQRSYKQEEIANQFQYLFSIIEL